MNWYKISPFFFFFFCIDCFGPCLERESKIHPSGTSERSQNIEGDFKYALHQVVCFVGGVPKFLSVLMRLEAIRVKFQSVIPVLR